MPTVKVNDIEMYYEEQGVGDPLIMIPGLSGTGAGWGAQIPLFAKEFRTITVDHRGAGRSSAPETGYTIAQHASDMAGLLRALKAAPAHIFGASTGGAIGQVMALEHPETVRSLVLVGTWGRTDVYFRRLFETRKRVLQQLGHAAAVELAMLMLYSPAYLRAHWDEVQQLERQAKANPPDVRIAAKRIDMIIAHDALDRLKSIRQPTCIVVGDGDMVTPPYFSEELQRHIPQAELHVIPGTGHFAYLEKPDLFFKPVREFIRKTSGR